MTKFQIQTMFLLFVKHGIKIHTTATGQLKLKGLGDLPKDKAQAVIDHAREHKVDILAALKAGAIPCEICPCSGTWAYGAYSERGLLCFHASYYEGRPVPPVPCDTIRPHCPRQKQARADG